ncbi:hypothetical protein LRS74_22530 [Streptomyces sp. LX-29]|uniref:hypothetical protein n=1 Tax=Streptomyces sp. LX-29 TaxID=2900152 RepID=UPI00240E3DE3|nr:hypothetical protein [Streptomyces sp. LX-29]WFB09514.1 hypothetical protein LRS74_22530 [Streptomyces sp. LX-29]
MRELEFQMSRPEFARDIVTRGRDMGENVACSARLIAAWEDGTVRCPQPPYRRILTDMTGRSMMELGFRVPTAPSAGGDAEMERRDFVFDGVALVLPKGVDLERAPGRVGAREIRTISKAVHEIYSHDHDHGSASLRRAAADALHTAYRWLQDGTYTQRTGQKLRSAAGFLSIAAGWLSYDSGRSADARSLYGEALAAARIADDAGLEAHAFGCLSLLAKASGRPREAISAAQGAQTVARNLESPRMLALFHMREASGWALMGDRSAVDRAVVRAHNYYAHGSREMDPDWLEFFTPAELAGLESLCRADLGQHDRAAAGAEQAVLLHGEGFARNRALYTADVAIQQAVRDRPEPEAAAEAAGLVLAFIPEVKSDRLLKALHDVAGALQRHSRVPAVAHWLEQYRTTTGCTPKRSEA